MNVSLRYRDEVQGVSQPVLDEFDALTSQLQAIQLPTVEASASLYAQTTQTVGTVAIGILTLDRRAFGSDAWFETPNIITVPPGKDGIFLILAQTFVAQSGAAATACEFYLRVDGQSVRQAYTGLLNAAGGESDSLSIQHVQYLSAGSQVGLYAVARSTSCILGASDPTLATRITVLRLAS